MKRRNTLARRNKEQRAHKYVSSSLINHKKTHTIGLFSNPSNPITRQVSAAMRIFAFFTTVALLRCKTDAFSSRYTLRTLTRFSSVSTKKKSFQLVENNRKGSIVEFQLSALHQDSEKPEARTMMRTSLQILNAAFLVAGTTIGGGFLALPSIVSPSGFYPSAASLVGVWMYFLAQSFGLVECITRGRSEADSKTDEPQGFAATAKSVFGSEGEIAISILLIILIEATLVSQISRAGMMFPNYRAGCLLSAVSIAAVVFVPRSGIVFASKANAAMTSIFLLSALSVFRFGIPIADWSRLSLSNDFSSIPSALPTFLQLLVYGEIVPSVCQILKYNTKHIHCAIIMGSLMTLLLQIGWSGLGLSLVTSTVADPVSVLLASSGPVQMPLFCLAFTAILTTILGSYLALLSPLNDFLGRRSDEKKSKSYSESILRRIKVASIITIPASVIACTSPTIFLSAIDFAGSYPVLLLWGVIPPITVLFQRMRERKAPNNGEKVNPDLKSSGSSLWLVFLAAISLAMVGMNVFDDMLMFLKKL